MLSPSFAPSPDVSVAPSVSVDGLNSLVGGVDPSGRTSAQQQQAQQRALAALSSGGTLAENMATAKQLGLHQLEFAHRIDDLNIVASGANGPKQGSGTQKTEAATPKLGQQGPENDREVDAQSPLGSAKEQATDQVQATRENATIALGSPKKDQNLEERGPVQSKVEERDPEIDKSIAAFLKNLQNGAHGQGPASISLQRAGQEQPALSEALARLREKRASSLETRPLNLAQEDSRETVMAERPAANDGLVSRAEPLGHQELPESRASVSFGQRTDRQQGPVSSGVALNLAGGGPLSEPEKKDDSLSFA